MRPRLNRRQLGLFAASAVVPSMLWPRHLLAQSDTYPGNGTPPLLIDAQWLTDQQATDSALAIYDLRPLRHYRSDHIPDACHLWWQDTMEWNSYTYGTVLAQVEAQRQRHAFLATYGIGPDTQVIAYDGGNGQLAARLIWFLRFLGHTKSSMLDGGMHHWQNAGMPLDRQTHTPVPPQQTQVVPAKGFYCVTPELVNYLEQPEAILIDCRTESERLDTVNGTLPQGQIPGSIWFPRIDAIDAETSLMRTAPDLHQQFKSLGVQSDHHIFVYARYGVEAAHTWLVLKLLGFPKVTIYDTGWAHWSQQSDLPTAPL